MTNIVWEEPPPAYRRTAKVDNANARVLAELQANPGQWALIHEDAARSVAAQWRKKGCEARTVSNGKGVYHRGKLYLRWPA